MTPERAHQLMIRSLHEYTTIIEREARREAMEEAWFAARQALDAYDSAAAIRAMIEKEGV